MKLGNRRQTVKKMQAAAYGMGDPLFHCLIFLFEPNQVFLTVAILLFFGGWQRELRGLGRV